MKIRLDALAFVCSGVGEEREVEGRERISYIQEIGNVTPIVKAVNQMRGARQNVTQNCLTRGLCSKTDSLHFNKSEIAASVDNKAGRSLITLSLGF